MEQKRVYENEQYFFFWRALKEYYDYSLISTCKESSRYFWETIMTVRWYILTLRLRHQNSRLLPDRPHGGTKDWLAGQPIQITYKMTKERPFTPSWLTKTRTLEQDFYENHNLASESFLFNKETLVEIFFDSVFGYLSLSNVLIWTSTCESVQYKRNIQNRKIQSKRVLGLMIYTLVYRS
jgi:hypothetical protein